jgi:hypothetical protein
LASASSEEMATFKDQCAKWSGLKYAWKLNW